MGGSNDSTNLIELTIEEHAEAHRQLYVKYGKDEDYIAWKALSGQIGSEEILLEKIRLGLTKHSDETKEKLRMKAIGRKRSETSKLKQSKSVEGNKNHFYGKTHSEEFCKKQSIKQKSAQLGPLNTNAKAVIYNNIQYGTMKDMSTQTGISLYNIRKMVNDGSVRRV